MSEDWRRLATIAWLTGFIQGLPEHCEIEKYKLGMALELLQATCSCGDPTILGVIHSDTKPCSLPIVRMPLTDEQILQMAKWPETDIEFARAIEEWHGIKGIKKL